MAKTRLTATETSGAGVILIINMAGHSDPVILNGKIIAQRIIRYAGDNRLISL